MNLSASPSDEAAAQVGTPGDGKSPRTGSMKFLYPTGSRPLDGYTIKRGVGRGGFGEVYFATSDAGKEVALKLIRRNLDVELRGVTHCINLKHSNLIGLYDIREDESGDQWVIMEYVAGDSLEQAIQRHPEGMDEATAVRWFREMCAGVAYLHDHGIVHRDLKPANVFLDDYSGSQGTVKIGDYGLAKFISCSRRSGQTESVGTVHYMAPEIANGRYGREVDTYALGIILYEMLTGRVPFEGESMGEVIMKHLTAEPDLSLVPSAYRTAVERTLAKDPDLRVGSVGELVALLPGGDAQNVPVTPVPAPDGLGDSRQFANTQVRGVRQPVNQPRPKSDRVPEPLAMAISENWNGMLDSWHNWDVNPAFKGVLLFLLVMFAVFTGWAWIAVAAGLSLVYLFYYVVWSLFIEPGTRAHRDRRAAEAARYATRKEPVSAAAQPQVNQAAAAQAASAKPVNRPMPGYARRPLRRHEWVAVAEKKLRETPWRDALSGWLVTLLASAVLCTMLSLVAVALAGFDGAATNRVALHLWLSTVTTASAWTVITITRFAAGRFEDQVPLRAMMLGGGLLVGCLAYGMSDALVTGVPHFDDMGPPPHDTLFGEMFDFPVSNSVRGYGPNSALVSFSSSAVYFALLFLALRWWKLSEYTRDSRLSFWRIGLTIAGAFVLHTICWYPQPSGIMVAGIAAVAIQLTSPWLKPSERRALVEPHV